MNTNTYRVADFLIAVSFADGQGNGTFLIPSFEPFRVPGNAFSGEEPTLSLRVDNTLPPLPKRTLERIKAVDGGNGEILVDRASDGGYQFIFKDIWGRECSMLQTDPAFSSCRLALRGDTGMRLYGLNNAIMTAFAFATCCKDTILLHASAVRYAGHGYAFTAKSGTGKSTHVAGWLANIPGCDMINDDNPVARVIGGHAWLYGSPWSGKTPCYRNIRVPLGALVKVNRSERNYVAPSATVDSFVTLISGSATMKWDSTLFGYVCNSITALIQSTPIYNLYCRPDREAAIICCGTIAQSNT
ncbi:MAG: hypothetical protein LUC22_04890 [Prevotella sp.]|nr:hypothetical protein [Prevotella sp.]